MNYERGGIAFVGCVVLGVGFGALFNQWVAGPIIGVGVGFILMAVMGKEKIE
ncbi:hypothetical protein [Ornithinibacillus halotolerans]|uniref:Uncharacterized protein n=1 Tax=Ornithinibacillus halotolerans TaxID=1274357 RepID=A0A916RQL9_9BACI|nr:hypothetical protein [Ornithinibacillus halotolerans]GGA65584.1 hypothetical protein GCM10008025_06750 [Ornithinibacillus halotolerans]